MRLIVSIAVLFLVACASVSRATTYSEMLGVGAIRAIVQDELARTSDLRFSEDAREWVVEAAGRVEASDSREAAEAELRKGFRAFLTEFGEFARERGVRDVTQRDVAEFQVTAAGCGMIPCSPRCCEFCEPC